MLYLIVLKFDKLIETSWNARGRRIVKIHFRSIESKMADVLEFSPSSRYNSAAEYRIWARDGRYSANVQSQTLKSQGHSVT